MKLLAIETSSACLSLAVGTEDQVLKRYQGPLAWRHAESLFEGMEKLLAQVRWPVQSLDGVVVSIGPGSFTGIRIGIAAARALGQSLNIPVQGLSSLETLAEPLLQAGTLVCPVIDALRGEVFTALYEQNSKGKKRTLLKAGRLPIPELIEKFSPFIRQPLVFVGDATAIHKEALIQRSRHWRVGSEKTIYPQAGVLLELGRNRLKKQSKSYQQVMPLYLRSAAAVERRRK